MIAGATAMTLILLSVTYFLMSEDGIGENFGRYYIAANSVKTTTTGSTLTTGVKVFFDDSTSTYSVEVLRSGAKGTSL